MHVVPYGSRHSSCPVNQIAEDTGLAAVLWLQPHCNKACPMRRLPPHMHCPYCSMCGWQPSASVPGCRNHFFDSGSLLMLAALPTCTAGRGLAVDDFLPAATTASQRTSMVPALISLVCCTTVASAAGSHLPNLKALYTVGCVAVPAAAEHPMLRGSTTCPRTRMALDTRAL